MTEMTNPYENDEPVSNPNTFTETIVWHESRHETIKDIPYYFAKEYLYLTKSNNSKGKFVIPGYYPRYGVPVTTRGGEIETDGVWIIAWAELPKGLISGQITDLTNP